LGVVGVLTAFNFPVSPSEPVSTNTADVVGSCIRLELLRRFRSWKLYNLETISHNTLVSPVLATENTTAEIRCAIAITKLIEPILEKNGLPGAAAALVCGDIDVGKEIVGSQDIPLGMSPLNEIGLTSSEFHRQ